MSVRIQLNKQHACFTNLDHITGIIHLSLLGDETITAIVVKLEGESITKLIGFPVQDAYSSRSNEQVELEIHKLLYKVKSVFPPVELVRTTPPNSSYTLPPGQHKYPFEFKLPFNNDCSSNSGMGGNFNVAGLLARDTNRHVKQTLPPSLNGFPGEGEIRYYVKVTVQRAAFYKENFRATTEFMFLPIEPRRPPANTRESYARRQHQFTLRVEVPTAGKNGLFRKSADMKPESPVVPPRVSIDGRLPDPAIITCNSPLPLRILVTKLNESSATIFLHSLQIELTSFTKFRAQVLEKTERTRWVIRSLTNQNIPLGNSEAEMGKDIEVDAGLWNQISLPNTVAPSFDTCNISRSYALDISVGLAWGSANNISPEHNIQTLHMPVQVFSGIPPPQALLTAMANRPVRQHSNLNASPPSFTGVPSNRPSFPPPQQSQQPLQQPLQQQPPPPGGDFPEEAPPSYEDAMAVDVGPVDGPRQYYNQPEPLPSKSSGSHERLFPDRS